MASFLSPIAKVSYQETLSYLVMRVSTLLYYKLRGCEMKPLSVVNWKKFLLFIYIYIYNIYIYIYVYIIYIHIYIYKHIHLLKYNIKKYINIFIYTQLQSRKVQSPDIIYLVCPGVK